MNDAMSDMEGAPLLSDGLPSLACARGSARGLVAFSAC